jgi:hypothetical protein
MEDYILNLIKDVMLGVTDLGSGSGVLTKTPETFNVALFNGVNSISQSAVMPVAYVFLGLIFMLELYNITIRTDGQAGTMGYEIPFKVMFKLAICKIAVDSTPLILAAIFSVSNEVILNMGGVFGSHSVSVLHNIDAMKETIANMDFGVKLMTSVQVTIIWLVFKFSTMAIMLVIIGRMIQIYIMMAIAAIPMATMANADLSSVGKNFLKSFAAVCVQGTLIYIVLNMYGTLVGSVATSIDNTDITAVLFEALLYSLVLVMAIFATGRISKSICNAM